MSKRQSPLVRAGSGDSHEARIAVLEQRFSDEMKARCSWCNAVKSARDGEWLEVVFSSPGTGIRPAHVFRCLGCEGATAGLSGSRVLAVPSGARRPGDSPPPVPEMSAARAATAAAAGLDRKTASGRSNAERRRTTKERGVAADSSKGAPGGAGTERTFSPSPRQKRRPAGSRPQVGFFPGV